MYTVYFVGANVAGNVNILEPQQGYAAGDTVKCAQHRLFSAVAKPLKQGGGVAVQKITLAVDAGTRTGEALRSLPTTACTKVVTTTKTSCSVPHQLIDCLPEMRHSRQRRSCPQGTSNENFFTMMSTKAGARDSHR